MASIYRANLVQDLEPATPDYQALIRGQEMIGKSNVNLLKKLGEVGMSGYKAYVEEDIKSMTVGKMVKNEKGELVETNTDLLNQGELPSAYATRNQAEQKAKLLEAEQKRLAGMEYEETADYGGFQMPADYAKKSARYEAAQASELTMISGEVQRLRQASMGGMSKEEYVARVSALTKKAMAKYPHLSDKIRERVGIVTGLPYADQWASMQYVKDAFTKSTATSSVSPEKMRANDIKEASALGLGTQEELSSLYTTDRAKYDQVMRDAQEIKQMQAQETAVKSKLAGETIVADSDADKVRSSFLAIFQGSLGTNVLSSVVKDKDQHYGKVLALMARGENIAINPSAFATQIEFHAATMRANIDAAYRTAETELNVFFEKNPRISDAKRKEMREDLDRAKKTMMTQYGSETGLVAMATILSKYRDKSIAEKQKVMELAIAQQNAMKSNWMVSAYWGRPEDRENLRLQYPDFYAFMQKQESIIVNSMGGITDAVTAGGGLKEAQAVMDASRRSPDAVEVSLDALGAPTNFDSNLGVNMQKVAHQAMMGTAQTLLQQAARGKLLDTPSVNAISSALATSAQYGANANILMNTHGDLWKSISALPQTQQSVIKESVSKGAVKAMTTVQGILKDVETKYGVKLKLGINSDGEVGIAPLTSAEASRFSVNTKYTEAGEEFRKNARPLIRTAIFGRAAVTGEAPVVGARQFLDALQSGTMPKGFFSTEAVEVKPEASGTVQQLEGQTAPTTSMPPAVEGTPIPQATAPATEAPAAEDNRATASGEVENLDTLADKIVPNQETQTKYNTLINGILNVDWLNQKQAQSLIYNVIALFERGAYTDQEKFIDTLKRAPKDTRANILKALNAKIKG